MAHRPKAGNPKKPRRATTSSPALRRAKKLDPIEDLVAASADALTLPIDPSWRIGVKHNLHLILEHAASVDRFSLPDDVEPAPVFRA